MGTGTPLRAISPSSPAHRAAGGSRCCHSAVQVAAAVLGQDVIRLAAGGLQGWAPAAASRAGSPRLRRCTAGCRTRRWPPSVSARPCAGPPATARPVRRRRAPRPGPAPPIRPAAAGWCGPSTPGWRSAHTRCRAPTRLPRAQTPPGPAPGGGGSPADALAETAGAHHRGAHRAGRRTRLARPLATDLRRPWERPAPPGRLTPARVASARRPSVRPARQNPDGPAPACHPAPKTAAQPPATTWARTAKQAWRRAPARSPQVKRQG